jgi:CheY-like chemotaxis protein
VIDQVDIFITATGNKDVFTVDHLLQMKHQAIVANVGHFDNEIDMAGLESLPGATSIEIKPQVHEWQLPNGRSILMLSEGRLMNLGNATGHPSFVMSTSFANQVLAQIELFTSTRRLPDWVFTCCPRSSMRRWRACTWMRWVWSSRSSPTSRPPTSVCRRMAPTRSSTTATRAPRNSSRLRAHRETFRYCDVLGVAMTARILVVDDDVALAEMISIILRGEGYIPYQAFDGQDALAQIPESSPI